jgi:hypothetical protein
MPQAWPYVSKRLDVFWLPDAPPFDVPVFLMGGSPSASDATGAEGSRPFYRLTPAALLHFMSAIDTLHQRLRDAGQDVAEALKAAMILTPLLDWVRAHTPAEAWVQAYAERPPLPDVKNLLREVRTIDLACQAIDGAAAARKRFESRWRGNFSDVPEVSESEVRHDAQPEARRPSPDQVRSPAAHPAVPRPPSGAISRGSKKAQKSSGTRRGRGTQNKDSSSGSLW